jgi:hypothetical protein
MMVTGVDVWWGPAPPEEARCEVAVISAILTSNLGYRNESMASDQAKLLRRKPTAVQRILHRWCGCVLSFGQQ